MKKLFVLCMLVLLITAPDNFLYSQSRRTISLEQAVESALQYNRGIVAQQNKLSASDWSVRKAYSEFLPKVAVNQRLTRVDNTSLRNANFAIEGLKSFPGFEDVDIPPMLYKDTYETSMTMNQSLFTGGRLSGGLELAKITQESDRLLLKDTQKETEFLVKQAYLEYAKSLELVKVQKSSLELAKKNLGNVKIKNELGLRPRADILRWEAQVALEESNLIEVQNAAYIAKIQLANLMGIDLMESFEIEIVTESAIASARYEYEQFSSGELREKVERLFSDALRFNPGRQNVSLQKSISSSSIKIARSGFLPQIALSANYSWQANDTAALDGFKAWDASITLNYSIFNGFGDYTDLQKAKAEMKQMEMQEQDYDRGLKVSVFTSYNNIRKTLAKLTLAEKNLLQASDNRQLVQNRYELGLASNIDLIDAQVLETTAQVDLISARHDLLIAGAELDRIIGRPVGQN